MAIKTISQFEAATPTSNDKILFEQNGEGKSATFGDVGKAIGINMDLLWTNASPSSAFEEQTISLDLSPYKLVLIKTRTRATAITCFDFISQIDGIEKHMCYPRTQLNLRGVKVEANQIFISKNVAQSSFGGSDETNNSTQIPYKIYGVK